MTAYKKQAQNKLLFKFVLGPFLLLISSLPAIADHRADSSDIHAIRNLLHRYAMFIDDARGEEFEELFSKDAKFIVLDYKLVGAKNIRKEFIGPPGRLRKHLPFTAVIDLQSASNALAWSDFIMVKIANPEKPGDLEIYQMGRYHDRLVKEKDGHWRFTERRVFLTGMDNQGQFLLPPAR